MSLNPASPKRAELKNRCRRGVVCAHYLSLISDDIFEKMSHHHRHHGILGHVMQDPRLGVPRTCKPDGICGISGLGTHRSFRDMSEWSFRFGAKVRVMLEPKMRVRDWTVERLKLFCRTRRCCYCWCAEYIVRSRHALHCAVHSGLYVQYNLPCLAASNPVSITDHYYYYAHVDAYDPKKWWFLL